MVAVHGQRNRGVGHLHLNALHGSLGHVADRVAEHQRERCRQAGEANRIALLTGLTTVGDGPDGFTRFVFKRLRLLQDVELTRAVGNQSGLFDGVGHVAVVVFDVADQQGAARRAVKLHVSNFVDRVEGMTDVRDAANRHAHRHGNEGVYRAQPSVNDGNAGILRKQNVIHVGQPRLRAAGQGKPHVCDFHRFTVAAWQALLHLVEALNVNDAARRTRCSNHGRWEAVQNGTDVEHDFDDREQRIVKELRDRVEVRVVEIDAVDPGGGEQETALNHDDAGQVVHLDQHGRGVAGIPASLERGGVVEFLDRRRPGDEQHGVGRFCGVHGKGWVVEVVAVVS